MRSTFKLNTLYNTHCFSTATTVARTRLSVTLHVNCLSRFVLMKLSFCKKKKWLLYKISNFVQSYRDPRAVACDHGVAYRIFKIQTHP